MENVISARRLRKSMLNSAEYNSYSSSYSKTIKDNDKKKIGIMDKFLIKSAICSVILFITIFCVKNYKEELSNNKIVYRLYEHYKFDFSKELILYNFENGVKNIDKIMGDIVPVKVKENIVNLYNNKVKSFILNFGVSKLNDKKSEEISLYNEPLAEQNVITKNNVNIDAKDMLASINIINPTIGTVTSKFGQRDVIFEGVNPYHTGIDIANSLGTDIVSVCDGIVENVVYDDKYYGNYIEIKMDEIIFKYAHLSEILVNKNDVVKQNMVVGKMGSTGMSTGPHLHFEIRQGNVLIDPLTVLEL